MIAGIKQAHCPVLSEAVASVHCDHGVMTEMLSELGV